MGLRKGTFPSDPPRSVTGKEQPVGKATSAKAEVAFRAECSSWCPGPHMLLGAEGLQGVSSWPLAGPCPGSLMTKPCGPCLAHVQSRCHMTRWNMPWNWH